MKKKKENIPYFTKGFLINAGCAEGLVFMGGLMNVGEINFKVILYSLLGAGFAFLLRLKEWSDNKEKQNPTDNTSQFMHFI